MRTKRHLLCVLTVSLLAATSSGAADPWSDPKLPVSDGLELWLDATRIAQASEAAGAAPPRPGAAVGAWYDGSGNKRHAQQPAQGRRPILKTDLVPGGPAPVMLFDGRDDGLVADVAGMNLKDFTLIAVASPFSNGGFYRAILAANEANQNDFTSGLNLDQGGGGTSKFERVNLEGKGFGGEKDLLNEAATFDFGTFHTLCLTGQAGGYVRLHFDGAAHSSRPRTADSITPSELRVGMRYAGPGQPQPAEMGFFDGGIAEILIYRRVLSDNERAKVEAYLRQKHAPLFTLKGVPSRPTVQMLVPGFTVRELPVKLNNLTNIRYGPDGKLYATGYDGRIHRMSDSDGDGLEDRAEVLWDKPTFRTPMALGWQPGNDKDLFVVSNGKISVLRDTNGDGLPDRDEMFNTGWLPDAGFTGGGVDALGLAFDAEGNAYIGLGCTLFANPYLVDEKTGTSRYDIRSERGTILKISRDGKKREIVCTGIRFPVGLAMNKSGDLFCTDQEGATWLPEGNPLDELNHIVPGRHYGFPQRHEKYLPSVVDEPPAVLFGPQHQSTCGLTFNEPARTGTSAFGPDSWRGDGLVAGFSRGKLWRVPLVKSNGGYVGRPHLIATSRMMLLDPAVDPQGNLTVAFHSGEPDWGTGPGGAGKLFKFSYTDRKSPQPVIAWAEGPTDVRVAFDRPVESNFLGDLSKISIAYGEFVRAGDEYEVLKPPYAVVAEQSRAFRGELRVASARLSDDRRTLHLTTDPHPIQAWYAVSIPLADGPLPDGQDRVIELDYDLTGVEATFTKQGVAAPTWSGWLPHPDPEVSQVLTKGSAAHDRLFEIMRGGKGELRVLPGRQEQSPHVAYRNSSGPVPLWGRYPAWVPTQLPPAPPPPSSDQNLAGGDWQRGQELFFGAEANCATCHTVRGKGGHVGPDLSNLPHRDAAGIYRDITEPNVVINPDHRGYIAILNSGDALQGLVRSDREDRLRIYDTAGKETVVPRGDVKQLRAATISIMPEGYEKLGRQKIVDLITFLTHAEPPKAGAAQPAADAQEKLRPLKEGRIRESGGNRPPSLRSRRDVEAVIAKGEKADPQKLKPLRVLLVAGPKDHGPGEHDYPLWQKEWAPLLKKSPRVDVSTAFGVPKPEQWESADLAVFYCWGPQFWSDKTGIYEHLDKFLARGGGVVLLHSATIAEKDPKAMADHLGLCYAPMIKFRHGPLDLKAAPGQAEHPVLRGFGTVHHVDESYWPHVEAGQVQMLATTPEEGQERPMAWAGQRGGGRIFGTLLGHYTWTFDDPMGRLLILRGMAWAAGQPAGRFDALALDGVELKE